MKVIIKRLESDSKSAGGIVQPDSDKEKPKRGTVVSTGEGRLLETGQRKPLTLKKGDVVLFTSYAGTEVKVDGHEMIIMDENDVIAVLG